MDKAFYFCCVCGKMFSNYLAQSFITVCKCFLYIAIHINRFRVVLACCPYRLHILGIDDIKEQNFYRFPPG